MLVVDKGDLRHIYANKYAISNQRKKIHVLGLLIIHLNVECDDLYQ